MYLNAVEDAFGGDMDFSQIIKLYGNSPESEVRYSPQQNVRVLRLRELKAIQIVSMFLRAMLSGKTSLCVWA